jgi:electron transfer flavoprotein alpha/beta subunit
MKVVVCLHAAAPGGTPLTDNDTEALRLAQSLTGEHEIIALLAGTKDEAAPLEAACAAGVDRAARITGESFAAADFHTLGQVLGSAALTLGAELILIGAHADTEGLGALSASVARHMGAPHLANIETLEIIDIDIDIDQPPLALVVTVRGGGYKRRLGVGLPIVMSVARGAATPPAAVGATAGTRSHRNAPAKIETLALFDPEVTVIRRRTEILGTSTKSERETKSVSSAAELVAGLIRRA